MKKTEWVRWYVMNKPGYMVTRADRVESFGWTRDHAEHAFHVRLHSLRVASVRKFAFSFVLVVVIASILSVKQ